MMLNSDNRLTFGVAAANLCLSRTRVYFTTIKYIRVKLSSIWLFRAVKKNCNSGEPASPIADRCASIERIKTDHNSYTASCHSLVFQQPMRIRDLSRGMVLSKINEKRLTKNE